MPHELTKLTQVYFSRQQQKWEDWETEVLLPYLRKKAEWLKKQCKYYRKGNEPHGECTFNNTHIDQAFGLSRKTLESMFLENLESGFIRYLNEKDDHKETARRLANITRSFLEAHPEELEGK